MHRTLITAHSGAEGTAPNSLEFVRMALTLDCEALEIDIRPVNGELRLTHDVPEDPASAPLLSECFKLFAASAMPLINCDIKTEGIVADVLAMAAEHGICSSRLLFTGDVISARERQLIRAAGADVWLNVPLSPMPTSPADFLARMAECGAHCMNNHYSLYTPALLTALDEAGLKASAWTVDDEAEMERLLRAGVHNITTRHPLAALRLRAQLQG